VSDIIVGHNDHEIIASSIDGTVRSFDIRMGEVTIDDLYNGIYNICLAHD